MKIIIVFFLCNFLINLSANRILEFANRTHKEGDYVKAELFYLEALNQGANPAIINYNLGNLYYTINETGLAIYRYEQVIREAPQFKEGYHNLAKLYFQKEAYSKSLEIFQTFLNIAPQDFETHLLIGDVYRKLRLPGKAIRYYEAALKSQPQISSPYLSIADVYRELDDSRKSIATLERLEIYNHDNDRIKILKGDLYFDLEDYYKAYSQYESVKVQDYQLSIKIYDALLLSGHTNQAIYQLKEQVLKSPILQTGIYRIEDFYLSQPTLSHLFSLLQFTDKLFTDNPKESLRMIKNVLSLSLENQYDSVTKKVSEVLKKNKLHYQTLPTQSSTAKKSTLSSINTLIDFIGSNS